jgi:hypothetical protein
MEVSEVAIVLEEKKWAARLRKNGAKSKKGRRGPMGKAAGRPAGYTPQRCLALGAAERVRLLICAAIDEPISRLFNLES